MTNTPAFGKRACHGRHLLGRLNVPRVNREGVTKVKCVNAVGNTYASCASKLRFSRFYAFCSHSEGVIPSPAAASGRRSYCWFCSFSAPSPLFMAGHSAVTLGIHSEKRH